MDGKEKTKMTNDELLDRFRKINAIHEAGHAVASLAFGSTVHYACVDNADPLGERGSFGHVARSPQSIIENDLTVCLAGVGAEIVERQDGSTWSGLFHGAGSGDWKNAQWLLREKSAVERRKIIKQCKARSFDILHANWSAVLRTADALLATGYVESDKLQSLFQG